MTLGILIILALVTIAVVGAWHIAKLYQAIEALLVFYRHSEHRIHNLEHHPPWLDHELGGEDGGAHGPGGAKKPSP